MALVTAACGNATPDVEVSEPAPAGDPSDDGSLELARGGRQVSEGPEVGRSSWGSGGSWGAGGPPGVCGPSPAFSPLPPAGACKGVYPAVTAADDTLPADTLVEQEGSVSLLGLVGDDVIYTSNAGVFARPMDGSAAPTVIGQAAAEVVGGVVALSTPTSLSAWTRATGLVPMGSLVMPSCFAWGRFYWASDDGTRVAFGEEKSAGDEWLNVRVRNVADATSSALLSGSDNAINVAAKTSCPFSAGFRGTTFFAQFCPGVDPTAGAAKLVMVRPDGSVVRLDAAEGAAPTLKPGVAWGPQFPWGWYANSGRELPADETGSSVFVRRLDGSGAIIKVGATITTVSLPDAAEGLMLPDGSAAIYRTADNVLKKATTSDPPVITTLAAEAKGILGLSSDAKTVLFHKLDPVGSGIELVDISAVDHTAATPPVTLVPTPTAARSNNGLQLPRASASHLIFKDWTDCTANKVVPLTGGSTTVLGTGNSLFFAGGGTGAISDPSCPFGCTPGVHMDVVTGKKSLLADDVSKVFVTGDRVVYSATSYPPGGSQTSVIRVATLP